MFGKILLSILLLITLASANVAVSQNSVQSMQGPKPQLSEQKLYSYIDEYLKLTPPHIDSLKAACDYIIAFTQDTLIKPAIAGYLFNRFSDSSIMGQEEVAIYIAKNYFLNGKLTWSGSGGTLPLTLYVEFNESSLIGMEAPALNLKDIYGAEQPLSSVDNNYIIVYFFNDDCSVCREMLPKIRQLAENKKYLGISVYAVYTYDNPNRLEQFIAKEFLGNSDWVFALDSDNSSDFHKLYNVLKTPQIFLLDGAKRIIGRNLDDGALGQLLDFEQGKLETLNRETEKFVASYMPQIDLGDTTSLISAIGSIYDRTINQQDRQVYRTIFTHIIEYLIHNENDNAPEAALFISNRYILPDKEHWRNDTFMRERLPVLLSRIESNKIGATIYDMELSNLNGKRVSLHKIKSKYTYLYFFNNNCAICEAFSYELNKDYKKLKKKKIKVIGVYAGDNYDELITYVKSQKVPWDILWIGKEGSFSDLYMRFEIGQVPQTYLLDTNKRIIAKRINTIKLDEMVRN